MKPTKSVSIVLALALCAGAFAKDKEKKPDGPQTEAVTLTLDQAEILGHAFAKLNGSPVDKDHPDTLLPFTFNGDFTRTALYRDVEIFNKAYGDALTAAQKALADISKVHRIAWTKADARGRSSVDEKKTKPEDEQAAAPEIQHALSWPFTVNLYKISEDDLNVKGNSLPITIGAELAPIIKAEN